MSVTTEASVVCGFDTDVSVGEDAAVKDAAAADRLAMKALGERVRQSRKGMTQSELAEKAGVDKETVNRMELGSNMQLLTVFKVARALNVSSAEILVGRDLIGHTSDQQSGASPAGGSPIEQSRELQEIQREFDAYKSAVSILLEAAESLIEADMRAAERREKSGRATPKKPGRSRRHRKAG